MTKDHKCKAWSPKQWIDTIPDLLAKKPPMCQCDTNNLTTLAANIANLHGAQAGLQVAFNLAYERGYRDAMAKASADLNAVEDKLKNIT